MVNCMGRFTLAPTRPCVRGSATTTRMSIACSSSDDSFVHLMVCGAGGKYVVATRLTQRETDNFLYFGMLLKDTVVLRRVTVVGFARWSRLQSGAVVAFVCIQGQSRSVLMARAVMEALGVDAESACQDTMLLTSRLHWSGINSLINGRLVVALLRLASSMVASLSCTSVC